MVRRTQERPRGRVTAFAACGALLVAALALTGCLGSKSGPVTGGGPGSASNSGEASTQVPAVPLPLADKIAPPQNGAYLGVYTPPAPFDISRVDAFEAKVGRAAAIVMWYQPWVSSNRSRFDTATVVAVMRRGKVPLITWEPWDPGSNANNVLDPGAQPTYRLSGIASGTFDPYIREWAKAIRALGGPIMLRPMHEMNGNWYPWSGTSNGNKPVEFVAAWRRIHDIFVSEGATNVTWVWSINRESVPTGAGNSFAAYYPGDAYVDWTALSGFNFGATSSHPGWHSFRQLYDKPLAYLNTLGKPICIAEFSSVEQGGDKAAWLTDAYANILKTPQVKAVVYFDSLEIGASARQDWRADTSPASLQALRTAIAPSYFLSSPPPELPLWADSLDARQWGSLTSVDPIY